MAIVESLHFYPIKSCQGAEMQIGRVTEKGFAYDRHWMVVDQGGLFVTQRNFSKMALIKPALAEDKLVISASGESSILEIPLDYNGARREVEVWGTKCEAVDNGEIASQWFSDLLGASVNLVYMPHDSIREKKPGYGKLQFADSYPFLIASVDSLKDLNERIQANGGQPVPMDRFRPNIVVDGGEPYAEDTWKQIQIGEVDFDVVKPCVRCPIPQIDQSTAIKGKEPTKTLLSYRRVARTEVIFAQKAVHKNTGIVKVGDQIQVNERKDKPILF
jgi:uncharacterized protein